MRPNLVGKQLLCPYCSDGLASLRSLDGRKIAALNTTCYVYAFSCNTCGVQGTPMVTNIEQAWEIFMNIPGLIKIREVE
jgi:hypothetical protein